MLANKINLVGWAILFFMTMIGVLGVGLLKIDKVEQDVEIQHYKNQTLVEQRKEQKYFGYISFPEYQVRRLIEYGNPNTIVEKYNIGIFGTVPSSLKEENIILVGHNRPNQFAVVPKLKIGDIVIVYYEKEEYYYQVWKRKIIDADDLSFLKNLDKKMLILVTCLEDASKRVVVFCKLQ